MTTALIRFSCFGGLAGAKGDLGDAHAVGERDVWLAAGIERVDVIGEEGDDAGRGSSRGTSSLVIGMGSVQRALRIYRDFFDGPSSPSGDRQSHTGVPSDRGDAAGLRRRDTG